MEPLELPEIVAASSAHQATVESDLAYRSERGRAFHADIYRDPDAAVATVILVHGEPVLEEGGCAWGEDRAIKDTGPLRSWARLLVQSGWCVVSFNHRASCGFSHPSVVDEDLDELLAFLVKRGLPLEHVGVLAFSGGTPFALSLARRDARVRAVVTMYGPLDLTAPGITTWFPEASHPAHAAWNPLEADQAPAAHLHIWPERDWLPNGSRAYAARAQQQGFPFTLATHREGGHGFDFLDDNARTHELIARVVDHFKRHLARPPNGTQASLFADIDRG